jgi:prepilin-type N-terminal cleavage/methylation domain-containing protein
MAERADGTGTQEQMNHQARKMGADVGRITSFEQKESETPHVVSSKGAFTLIELLIVIGIIALLAAMVVPLGSVAISKARISRVNAELQRYVMGIENYKVEVGEYPPDNALLKTVATNNLNWRKYAAFSPLYYELSGAVFTNKGGKDVFVVIDSNEEVTPKDLIGNFGVQGIRNSARDRHDRPFKGFSFRATEHRSLTQIDIELLEVPVPGPQMLDGKPRNVAKGTPVKFNPWYYDSSSTNRHNQRSFDLWTEILIGKEVHVIGNWKS